MKTYSLSQQGFLRVKRRIQVMGMTWNIVMVILILWVSTQQIQSGWLIALSVALLALVFGLMGIRRAVKSQQTIWESVKVELGDDYIARRQIRIEVRIPRDEITSIQETDSGLSIFTADKFRSLGIPRVLDGNGYEEIKTTLSGWVPVQPQSVSAKRKYTALIVLLIALLLVGYGVIFFSSSLWLTLLAGLVVGAYNIYVLWLLRRTEGVDPKTTRTFGITLIFLAFIISLKVCALSGALEFLILNWPTLAY